MFRDALDLESELDQRVRRTPDRLGDALVELLQHKPFDDIIVQNALDRAGVSRATFYAHYRDKNDLFLSDPRGIAQRLEEIPQPRCIPKKRRSAVAPGPAGNLIALLSWSIQHGMPLWADEMDRLFHGQFWAGLDGQSDKVPA